MTSGDLNQHARQPLCLHECMHAVQCSQQLTQAVHTFLQGQ